jgi:RNA polymerase sigma factor (TIGR02999 family)
MLLELTADGRPTRAGCDTLLNALYPEMRALAGRLMGGERADHTLQATALVHEAYLKLVDQRRARWQDRAHFLAVAAQVMRRILVDWARGRNAAKRGGEWQRVTLDENIGAAEKTSLDILALEKAMTGLAAEDERAAQVAELRLLGGLTTKETAEVVGVSTRTIEADWSMAKLWLARALRDPEA